ncbi:uncharacterized protein, partial [Narcine bancroftii]|uniref:uncharacterized protein n=1 Tax=Narcine bancroftii TaxID=1343680 RepID=UPI0038312BAE
MPVSQKTPPLPMLMSTLSSWPAGRQGDANHEAWKDGHCGFPQCFTSGGKSHHEAQQDTGGKQHGEGCDHFIAAFPGQGPQFKDIIVQRLTRMPPTLRESVPHQDNVLGPHVVGLQVFYGRLVGSTVSDDSEPLGAGSREKCQSPEIIGVKDVFQDQQLCQKSSRDGHMVSDPSKSLLSFDPLDTFHALVSSKNTAHSAGLQKDVFIWTHVNMVEL